MVSGVDNHDTRIGRVEQDVEGIRSQLGSLTTDVGGLKSDVKGLGAILGRIEQGVERSQERSDQRETASRPNLVAIVSVLITILSILVGGAWLISGQVSRLDERSLSRDREFAAIRAQVDRNSDRLWDTKTQPASPPGTEP